MKKSTHRPVPELQHFLRSHDKGVVNATAERAGTKVSYLKQIASGHRLASGRLSRQIENAVPGVKRVHLRPDLYGDLQSEVAPSS